MTIFVDRVETIGKGLFVVQITRGSCRTGQRLPFRAGPPCHAGGRDPHSFSQRDP